MINIILSIFPDRLHILAQNCILYTLFNMYYYCPKCGEKYTKTPNISAFTCEKCHFILYNNPKPVVIALIKNEQGNILLTQRAIEPRVGCWGLPGGFLQYGESPQVGLKRELQEELRATSSIGNLLATYHEFYANKGNSEETYSTTILVLSATLDNETTLTPADDIKAYKFFPVPELPANIAFEGQKKFLKKLQADIK